MSLNTKFFSVPALRMAFLLLVAGMALPLTGCSRLQSWLPGSNKRISALKLDPTEGHSLVADDGARWVLFKLDVGSSMRRVADSTSRAGQAVAEAVSSEERILDLIRQSRDRAIIEPLQYPRLQRGLFYALPVGMP